MKEIKSWKRSCPPYIVLLCPVNLLFRIFLLLKKPSRFMKNFYFRRKKLSRFFVLLFSKAETFAKMGKNRENRESFCPRKFLPLKYSVIELMFFEEPLPCQNENWGCNFSSTFEQNEYKYFHYIFFFLPTFWFFLEYRRFLPQESLLVKKKPDGIVHIAVPI